VRYSIHFDFRRQLRFGEPLSFMASDGSNPKLCAWTSGLLICNVAPNGARAQVRLSDRIGFDVAAACTLPEDWILVTIGVPLCAILGIRGASLSERQTQLRSTRLLASDRRKLRRRVRSD
jgi:hypothetical protein